MIRLVLVSERLSFLDVMVIFGRDVVKDVVCLAVDVMMTL